MNIYTKIGDNGTTKLQDGVSIPKHHPIIQALAAFDEFNAHLGIIKSQSDDSTQDYEDIQKNIMTVMSLISTSSTIDKTRQSEGWQEYFNDETIKLESRINAFGKVLPQAHSFVAYGASPQSANLDLARAVVRRAETMLTQAAEYTHYAAAAFSYINRLSDFLYVRARYTDYEFLIVRAVKKTLENRKSLQFNLSNAILLIDKIQRKAHEINLPVTIACCDPAGNPIATQTMDGALPISRTAALAKGYTAAAVRMSTAKLHELVQPGQPFYGLESLEEGRILPIGGGVTLNAKDGTVVGSIGVSGGTADEDNMLAEHGKSYWEGTHSDAT